MRNNGLASNRASDFERFPLGGRRSKEPARTDLRDHYRRRRYSEESDGSSSCSLTSPRSRDSECGMSELTVIDADADGQIEVSDLLLTIKDVMGVMDEIKGSCQPPTSRRKPVKTEKDDFSSLSRTSNAQQISGLRRDVYNARMEKADDKISLKRAILVAIFRYLRDTDRNGDAIPDDIEKFDDVVILGLYDLLVENSLARYEDYGHEAVTFCRETLETLDVKSSEALEAAVIFLAVSMELEDDWTEWLRKDATDSKHNSYARPAIDETRHPIEKERTRSCSSRRRQTITKFENAANRSLSCLKNGGSRSRQLQSDHVDELFDQEFARAYNPDQPGTTATASTTSTVPLERRSRDSPFPRRPSSRAKDRKARQLLEFSARNIDQNEKGPFGKLATKWKRSCSPNIRAVRFYRKDEARSPGVYENSAQPDVFTLADSSEHSEKRHLASSRASHRSQYHSSATEEDKFNHYRSTKKASSNQRESKSISRRASSREQPRQSYAQHETRDPNESHDIKISKTPRSEKYQSHSYQKRDSRLNNSFQAEQPGDSSQRSSSRSKSSRSDFPTSLDKRHSTPKLSRNTPSSSRRRALLERKYEQNDDNRDDFESQRRTSLSQSEPHRRLRTLTGDVTSRPSRNRTITTTNSSNSLSHHGNDVSRKHRSSSRKKERAAGLSRYLDSTREVEPSSNRSYSERTTHSAGSAPVFAASEQHESAGRYRSRSTRRSSSNPRAERVVDSDAAGLYNKRGIKKSRSRLENAVERPRRSTDRPEREILQIDRKSSRLNRLGTRKKGHRSSRRTEEKLTSRSVTEPDESSILKNRDFYPLDYWSQNQDEFGDDNRSLSPRRVRFKFEEGSRPPERTHSRSSTPRRQSSRGRTKYKRTGGRFDDIF